MSAREQNKKTKQTQIYFPTTGEFNIASFTDQILEIGQKGAVPIIDAHMHIQSNNIAPCTIQWGAIRGLLATALANNPELLQKEMEQAELYSGIAKWGAIPLWIVGSILIPMPATVRAGTFGAAVIIAVLADAINSTVKYLEHKDIDDLGNLLLRKADKEMLNTVQACISPLFMKDFGKLGVLDTDVVGKVFMGYDGELDVQNYAVNYQTYEHIKEIYGLDSAKYPFENSVINKASELFLGEMSEEEAMKLMTQRQDMMENFSYFTKYYYCNRDKTHLYCTMPMDLGYSHYWGYYSLPIYLPKNSSDLYYISEVPYYLGFMDNLRYFISFIEKEKNKHDKISPLTVKELVAKRVQKKIIDFSKKRIESLQSKLDTNNTRLTELESYFKNNAGITGKISELKNVIAEVKAGLNKLLYGNTETREKGIIERLNTDVIEYIISIIDAYINKTNEQAKEYNSYSSVPAEYSSSVEPKREEIERESEELYKIYHTLSCYAGKRIEDLEDFFKDQLNTLKTLLKRKFFNSLDECVMDLIYIRGEEQKGYNLPEGHMYKRQLNEAYDLIMENREVIKQDIQFIENRLKKEVSTVKEQIDVYNAGYNKILWHGIKPGDYTNYFRFGPVQCKGTEESEDGDSVKIVDIIPDDMIETINFASDEYKLSGENCTKLEKMLDELIQNRISGLLRYISIIHIKIIGHTSFTESKKDDARYLEDLQRLSENRAEYTKNKLLELIGSNTSLFNITTEGKSHFFPIASNSNDSGKAQNQRAEIYLIQGGLTYGDDEYDKYLDKATNHYLEIAPGNEKKYYEPYATQLARTIATGLRYPLKILPFYHYDPRRHYEGGDKFLQKLVSDIKENHGFFELEHGDNMQKPRISPVDFTDGYLMDVLKKNKSENSYAFDNLDTSKIGICWGYKMYTMLGYPPDLFNKDSYPGQTGTFDGRFDHLKSFFKHCISEGIPITCHGSPSAMTIADTILYLKEHNNEPPDTSEFKDQLYSHIPEEIKESLQFIDDSFVRPDSWRRVLETEGLGTLRLNLAHFAGYDSWYVPKDKKGNVIPPPKYANPDWRDELAKLMQDFDNVYTDISCYHNEEEQLQKKLSVKEYDDISDQLDASQKKLFEAVYKPVYFYYPKAGSSLMPTIITGIGKVILHYKLIAEKGKEKEEEEKQRIVRRILRRKGIIKDNLEEVAKNIADKIKEFPVLKKRIMMGSDWPMYERSFASSGEYYSRMFELLAMVTKYLDEDWDAWHQFSVINPLRFLGILKDEDGDKMTLDIEKIEGHRDAVKRFLDYEGDEDKEEILKREYRIEKDIDKIIDSSSGIHSLTGNFKRLQTINTFKIDQSDKLLDPNNSDNLLILKE